MVRYGILGFGLHAVKRLMPGFARAKHCTVTGLWRRDWSKAESAVREYSQFALRAYQSPEQLCAAPDVDVIFVASPDALHLEHVLLAVKHGKPVLCEKPMGMNAAQCEQMIAAAEAARIPLGVAHVFRFERSVNRIRALVRSGAIGAPLLAHSEFHYLGQGSARAWITDPSLAAGGPIGDVAVHCIDTLRYILADEVHAVFTRALRDEASGKVESAAILLLEFSRGALAEISVSTRAEYRTPLSITGSDGVISAEDALSVEHPVELRCKKPGQESRQEEISNEDVYAEQVDAFAKSVTGKTSFASPGIEGLRNQQVLDAAYRSVLSGNREVVFRS